MTTPNKYEAACREYAAAGAEVRRLGKAIGAAGQACHDAQAAAWLKDNPNSYAHMAPEVDHLKLAYAMDGGPSDSGYGDDRYFANHDDDVEGYLAETCPHCLAAHMAIQERKAARKRFGVAKRRITVLGKAAA